jgi:hypothetical protein
MLHRVVLKTGINESEEFTVSVFRIEKVHGITSQKTVLLIFIILSTSNCRENVNFYSMLFTACSFMPTFYNSVSCNINHHDHLTF